VFPYLYAAFLLCLLAVDYVFLPKAAQRAWLAMAIVFLVAAALAVFQGPLDGLRAFLGVGRAVDAIGYVSTAILVRELFLARSRHSRMGEELTQLTRASALRNATWFGGESDGRPIGVESRVGPA
jgi:hypothetical protein